LAGAPALGCGATPLDPGGRAAARPRPADGSPGPGPRGAAAGAAAPAAGRDVARPARGPGAAARGVARDRRPARAQAEQMDQDALALLARRARRPVLEDGERVLVHLLGLHPRTGAELRREHRAVAGAALVSLVALERTEHVPAALAVD